MKQKIMKHKSIWITWERQRRSVELAKAFNARYYELLKTDQGLIFRIVRYIILSAKTILIIFNEKPQIVFAQNPSIILGSLLCLIKKLFKFKLVIDRHSNFKLESIGISNPKWIIFHFLSKYTIRFADITIVTDEYLYKLVNSWNGRAAILQDKLPDLKVKKRIRLEGKINIVFVCTYSDDEPIEELIEAARQVDKEWMFYFTGNYEIFKKRNLLFKNLPNNIKLTGFLSSEKYESLIASADILVVLTKEDHTLNCGAYEGVALGKPIIVSDTKTIRNYFSKGVIYTKPQSDSISNAIKEGVKNFSVLKNEITSLSEVLEINWKKRFESLERQINLL